MSMMAQRDLPGPLAPPPPTPTRKHSLTHPPTHPPIHQPTDPPILLLYAGESKGIYTPVAADISLDHDDAMLDREMTDMSSAARASAVGL